MNLHKIFISSTYEDLKQYRSSVRDAILQLGYHPIAMEYFGARPNEPRIAALDEVAHCDALVGIYAYRYGSVPEGDTRSITEQEFDFARDRGIPCFCYRVDRGFAWEEKLKETGDQAERLAKFLDKIGRLVVWKEFTTPDDLASKVVADLGRDLREKEGHRNSSFETSFDCGDRIREVRKELGLTVSQLVESIGYFSEKSFARIEKRYDECPLSVIKSVGDFSGVSLDWLKHGAGVKYVPASMGFYPISSVIAFLNNLKPVGLHFVADNRSHEVVLVVQTGEYCWRVFILGFDLEFWKWVDDHGAIPLIYEFLDEVQEKFFLIAESQILSGPAFAKLTSGKMHALTLLRSGKRHGMLWADAIRDIDRTGPLASRYKKRYGEWFVRTQDEFKECLVSIQ